MTGSLQRTLGVTAREHDVLLLLADHLTNAEIAARLFLSTRTVESHVSSLIRRLGVADRRGVARRAAELGLLSRRQGVRWPRAGGRFVGREQETASLAGLLARHRMVTVTGPGGVGKTRLATLTAARMAEERPDGGWFVDLSQVTDPRAVTSAVAASVGVAEQPGRSVEDVLAAVLGRADGVLVLDNCEHLLATVERCVRRLLDACPRLTVVATSRVRVGAAYEWVYELPGLTTQDAALLFRARSEAAGGVVPEEAEVAGLCARLDGVPLAIELAAARYPSLGLDGLASALDDPLRLLGSRQGTRQRSMRATIGWSVDLLDRDQRAVLAATSVFVSPFTVAAARDVACRESPASEVAQTLAQLADQHLLRARLGERTTYDFQEVVRQYAAELPEDRGEVERRHAQWSRTALAALAAAEHDEAWCEAFDRLAMEVRAALGRGAGGGELGERFAEQLLQRGRPEEAQRVLETLAAADEAPRVRLLRLAAGTAAARLVGDDAMRLLEEAARAAVAAGRDDAAADALAWSVVYAALAPGIMAAPPAAEVTRSRLDEARARAPAGSPAEATVRVAAAAWLPDDDADAERASLRAADVAAAAGLPVAASAALDRACTSRLLRFEYAGALGAVVERGRVLDPLPLDATTAYAFNDYLLMGCEVSLAAGDLRGAATYAARLAGLPCYRDYVHPALARQLEVDVLAGDLTAAAQHGERFLASWEQAGRHRASTLAVGAYALAHGHGLRGDDTAREEWRGIARELVAARHESLDGVETGWAPTLDAWTMLDRGRPDAAAALLTVDLDHRMWAAWRTALWRPWYAAAWAEAAVLTGARDLDERLESAAGATRGNPVASALVRRAAALAAGDLEGVAGLAATFDQLGAAYQAERSRRLG